MFSNIVAWFIHSWNEISAFVVHNPVEAGIALGVSVGVSVVGIIFRQRKSK